MSTSSQAPSGADAGDLPPYSAGQVDQISARTYHSQDCRPWGVAWDRLPTEQRDKVRSAVRVVLGHRDDVMREGGF